MSKLGKLRVTLKSPDAVSEAIDRHAYRSVVALGLDDNETELLSEERAERIRGIARGWVECDEYVSFEIDLDADPPTARLLTVKEANGGAP